MSGDELQTIGIKLPIPVVSEIERRAAKMNISKTKFATMALVDWMKSGSKLTMSE